jgi:hypothetical protein
MLVTSLDATSLDTLLSWWESVEYVAEAFVILGCVGEFIADFTNIRTPEWRHQLSKASLLVLIVALAIELSALVRTNGLSGQEIALLNGIAADTRTRAANAESRIAGTTERTAQLEKDAARLKKKAEDERLARVEIEERVAWRRLRKDQQSAIGIQLRRFAGQPANMWYNAGDKEAETFALEIASALYQAQWEIFTPAGLLHLAPSGISFPGPGSTTALKTGVTVSSAPNDAGHSVADALIYELTDRGFDATRTPDSARSQESIDSPTLSIVVNVRPEGPQGAAKLRQNKKR